MKRGTAAIIILAAILCIGLTVNYALPDKAQTLKTHALAAADSRTALTGLEEEWHKQKIFFLIFAIIYLALFMLGDAIIKCRPTNNKTQKYSFLAIQGDLSQRRHATTNQAVEALEIYQSLTLNAIKDHQGQFDTIL
jgi:apolipoprotein N-acyltransferase